MSKLHGKLVIDRQLADDDLWLAEPFSRAQALFDLSLLANDTDRETRSRGIPVCLSRGQVGRSVSSLAERWQWSKDKTRRFLEDMRDRRKISFKMDNVATVITVLDYDVLNPDSRADQTPEPDAEPDAEPKASPTPKPTTEQLAEPTQNLRTLEPEKENLRTLEGMPPAKNAVSLQLAIEWCRKNESGYSDDEVKAAWNGLMAAAVDGLWMTGRRPVADWRCALTDECWKRRQIYGKKNCAPASSWAARASDEPPPYPKFKVTL